MWTFLFQAFWRISDIFMNELWSPDEKGRGVGKRFLRCRFHFMRELALKVLGSVAVIWKTVFLTDK